MLAEFKTYPNVMGLSFPGGKVEIAPVTLKARTEEEIRHLNGFRVVAKPDNGSPELVGLIHVDLEKDAVLMMVPEEKGSARCRGTIAPLGFSNGRAS